MEEATVRIDKTGNIMVMAGTISQGQGHDTVYKQIVAEQLGVPVDRIRVREGDTDMQGIGGGTSAGRAPPRAVGPPSTGLCLLRSTRRRGWQPIRWKPASTISNSPEELSLLLAPTDR